MFSLVRFRDIVYKDSFNNPSDRNINCVLKLYQDREMIKSTAVSIGVAPLTQLRMCVNKNSNIQGRSPNVAKMIFSAIRNYF